VITTEQLKTPMILSSHGAEINPHVGQSANAFRYSNAKRNQQRRGTNKCCVATRS
jgi:hypothetical protein